MHPASTSHSLLLFVPASLVIFVVTGVTAVSGIRTVMRRRSTPMVGSFLSTSSHHSFFLWRARSGSSLRQTGHTLPYCSPVSIEITLPCHHRQVFFYPIFSLINFILMRAPVVYPLLPFCPGTIIFSPGITSALQTSLTLRQVLDHFMECHLATDFGIVSRAMRFDNVLAALLETGQLTSRYYLHSTISPPETGLIITTHLDEHTTTIRFASEQE